MADAPIGFDESTPPDGFTGNEPVSSVSPLSTIFQPSPGPAMSWPSSHIGSYPLNGTYNSATSISWRGTLMSACLYTSCAHSTPACGRTGLRPGNCPSSLFTEVACTHAAGFDAAFPPASLVRTTAQAPSEDGHDSRNRSGSQSITDSFTFSMLMSAIFKCAQGFFSALSGSFLEPCQPRTAGAPVCSI